MASFSSLRSDVFSREQRRQHYAYHVMGLNAYDRHKKFMNDYVDRYSKEGRPASPKLVKTDMDCLREAYRFIRTEEDDMESTWEQRLAKRYYDKLFKEYCIADMSRYRESKVGLRWRSEREVVSGKGQFICGNKSCDEKDALRSYEVNFAYKESGESRQALVKLRVCPRCAYKLNYRKEKELQRQLSDERKNFRKRKREIDARMTPVKSDDDSEGGDHSNSGADSESSDEKPNENAGPRGLPEDVGTKSAGHVHPAPGNSGNEDFEKYFEGMFL